MSGRKEPAAPSGQVTSTEAPSGQVTSTEARGGNQPDWQKVAPGEQLPEMPPAEYPEPDSEAYPGLWPEDGWGTEEPPGANDPEAQ